ncbi:MAG: hypothetical protein FWF67_04300, partial [Fibromonadales bacterium]|nr:hypothetical protein [Fibromonadales bacterium]
GAGATGAGAGATGAGAGATGAGAGATGAGAGAMGAGGGGSCGRGGWDKSLLTPFKSQEGCPFWAKTVKKRKAIKLMAFLPRPVNIAQNIATF